MKSLFWILALFALAVGVSLLMRINEGYVLLVLPPYYRAEISLNLAVLAAALAFGVFHALLRAVALLSSLPRRLRESRARRRHEKAAETFAEGVRLYLAGERRKAIDTLAGLRGESDWTALAASLSARAADELQGLLETEDKEGKTDQLPAPSATDRPVEEPPSSVS